MQMQEYFTTMAHWSGFHAILFCKLMKFKLLHLKVDVTHAVSDNLIFILSAHRVVLHTS